MNSSFLFFPVNAHRKYIIIIIRLMNFEFSISLHDCSDVPSYVSRSLPSPNKKAHFSSSLRLDFSLQFFFNSLTYPFARSLAYIRAYHAHFIGGGGCCCRCCFLLFFINSPSSSSVYLLFSRAVRTYRLVWMVCCITLCEYDCHVAVTAAAAVATAAAANAT